MAVQIGLSGHHTTLLTLFGVFGNIVSGLVFLSPIPTMYQILKKRSSTGFNSTPYAVSLFSCELWLYYAIIRKNQPFLISINSAGAIIQSVYLTLFLLFSTKQIKLQTAKFFVFLNLAVFSAVVLIIQLIPTTFRPDVLGYICDIATIAVFGATLIILVDVIKTKDVTFMPLSLSASLTISSVVWFVYGLFCIDVFIMIPNVLGLLMGLLQITIFGVIKTCFDPRAATRSQDIENEENSEANVE